MKKLFCILCSLSMLTGVALSQNEGMRHDVNLSAMGVIQPYVSGGPNNVQQKSTLGTGLYLGYRYQLTPNGAFEANYSYSHFTNKFTRYAGGSFGSARVYTGMQEATFAYVRTFPFKRFNPFLEGGAGLLFFTPIGTKTTSYDTEETYTPAGLLGGGIAYELSPSWDLRVQYRGMILKTTDFGLSRFATDRYYIMSLPAIGFAYHF